MKIIPMKFQLALTLDAMHYVSAEESYNRVISFEPAVTLAHSKFDALLSEEASILEKYKGDSWAAYDELEPIAIQMEGANYNLSKAYAPFIRHISAVHIFSVACLESHINAKAKSFLEGKKMSSLINCLCWVNGFSYLKLL